MSDPFEHHTPSLESPAVRLAEVTPDDGADLPFVSRALTVTETYLQITTAVGDTGRIYVVAGGPFPIRASRVWATGTTATGIVSLA